MKIIFFTVILIAVSICVYFLVISITAASVKVGIVDGKLGRCGSKPNCVNSEYDGDSFVTPVSLASMELPDYWLKIKKEIEAIGGIVVDQHENYLCAEFRSRIFRFVDELEVRLDNSESLLHVRSGSRSGKSDFGVNRKRVEALRKRLGSKS